MASSQQSTFGRIAVNEDTSSRRCDGCTGFHEDGSPKRCDNGSAIVIFRERTGVAEFYCRIHAKDTWLEMAGVDNED
jgi:hypothetical protein